MLNMAAFDSLQAPFPMASILGSIDSQPLGTDSGFPTTEGQLASTK